MQHHKGILVKINDRLFDPALVRWMHGALPISELLIDRYKRIAPGKPYLKLPVLCDFAQFNNPKNRELQDPYFLYCGALDYREVLEFILESFNSLPSNYKIKLYLVVGETEPGQFNRFKEFIATNKDVPRINVFTKLEYSKLVSLYVNATALLIPLRSSLQDTARFPHKIGEYVASGNPIITTNIGEVAHYFEHEKTAVIADKYDVSSYMCMMKYVLDNPEKAIQIGENGKELGMKVFNYLNYGSKLKSFLEDLKK